MSSAERRRSAAAPGGPLPSYRIETWGCQMNAADSERIAGQLEARGFAGATGSPDADVVVLNTCAVREKAEAKVYSALGVLGLQKRERPELVIGVTGCVAQVEKDEIFERAPWVDFVAGTGNVERIGEIVESVRRERRKVALLDLPRDSPVYQFRQITRGSPFQAYVTVIEGCDQFCTFCIVPLTRGRERSRRSREILEELALLTSRGYSEVTLLGQMINAYEEPEEKFGLGELLRRAASVPGLRRLRFITSHPRFVDEPMIEALASGPPIAPYLHLPAQSGSDRVLFRMKRRYDRSRYLEVVDRFRSAVPGLAISSDFIVGFPGETETEFEETLSLMREVRFANVFGFAYSPRPGTAAHRWGRETEVAPGIAAGRLARLLALQEEIQAETNRSLVGRRFEVLLEGFDRKGQSRGRTPCNRIVHVESGPAATPGEYVAVEITRGLPNSVLGRVVQGGEAPW
jgi:tRNA-2-methylthio-N6-dimethylallyladenosine synthase